MLRRTAARAFGAGAGTTADVPRARHETHRGAAVERLFSDLHRRLTELLKWRLEAGERGDAGHPAEEVASEGETADAVLPSIDDDRGESIRISRPRALSGGVEFTLIGPSYSCRFVNTMTGFIRVSAHVVEAADVASAEVRAELLSVHPYWGAFRPILKPLECSRGAHRVRTAFCYTSAEELAAHYLDLVCGQ